MILWASRIVELINNGVETETAEGKKLKKPLIEGLSERQISGIEGTTVDLRLGEVYRLKSGARLLVDKRITPETVSLARLGEGDQLFTIAPNEFVLAQTVETVNLPGNLLADVRNRTTMFRCGLYLKTAYISPNYQGVLTFGLKNLSEFEVTVEMGFRIACVGFMEISGRAVPYHGVWQGKRASTDGKEERPF